MFHCTFDSKNRSFIFSPATACNSVIYIPKQHAFQTSLCVGTTIKNHSETTVNHFTPAHSATVVNTYPGCASETVANHVVNCHVGCKSTSVINIGSLTVWRIGSGNIVVITP